MPVGTLIGAGFVRIDADTAPAMKAVEGLGRIGSHALASAFMPVTAAITTAIGAMTASLVSAGAAGGAFAAAVVPQFNKITEASEKLATAEEADEKATIAKAHAQKLAKDMGVKYGEQIKITSKMSAESKAKAQEYNKALSDVTSATDAARKSQASYDEKLKAMTPATRETAKSFQGLKDDIEKWSDSLSGTTMPIFTAGIEKIRDLLPKLTPFVRIATFQIRQFASSFGEGQAGRVFKEFGANLQGNAGNALGNFLTAIKNVTVGVVGMINAFMPVQSDMSGGLADLTQRFADFGAGLGQSEGFATFIEQARGAVPAVKEFASAIGDILSAAGPMSGVGVLMLQVFSQIVAAIPTPVLRLLVPAILAVNVAMKLYAVYQSAAAAATWAFSTAQGASRVQMLYQNTLLVIMWVRMKAVAIATRIAAAAQLIWQLAMTAAGRQLALQIIQITAVRVAMVLHAAALRVAAVATTVYSAAARVAAIGTRLFAGALRIARAAVLLTAGAMRALAVAMLTNPIGLVITALVALGAGLYLAWKKSETFRNIVKGAWAGIKVAVSAVVDWFMGTVVPFFTQTIPNAFRTVLSWVRTNWPWILGALTGPIGLAVVWIIKHWDRIKAGMSAAWQYIVGNVLRPIGQFFTVTIPGWAAKARDFILRPWIQLGRGLAGVYTTVRDRVFVPFGNFHTKTIPAWAAKVRDFVVRAWNGLRDRLAGIYNAVRNQVFSPIGDYFTRRIPAGVRNMRDKVVGAWNGLRDRLAGAYASIRSRVFSPIGDYFTRRIPAGVRNMRDKAAGAWNGLRDRLVGAYSSIRNRVFSPMGNFFTRTIPGWARTMRDRVRGHFTSMRDGIGTIWNGIKSRTKGPVNWVLDRVWNRGLVNIWGRIAGWIGIKNKLKSVKLLAAGGTVGRATPGVFNKPTAIVGEGNPRYPEYVIPTDPKYATRARGLWQAAGAHFMEDGGILGTIKGALGSAIGTGKAALSFLSDPVDKARDLLMGPLNRITAAIGTSPWARMAARLPRMAVDGLIQAVKSVGSDLLGFGGGGNVDIGGSGVKRWSGVVQQALRMVGQPPAYTGITLRRMNQESGGNPRAVNKWDINWQRGYPSVGLMQVIRPTFQSNAGRFRNTGPFMYGVSINPLANIYASMRYALRAYGSLPRAYNRAGGYALGTDGATSGWHWTGELGPELMKLPAGTRIRSHRASLRQAASPATASVVHLTVQNHGVIGSRQQVLDWLVSSLDQLDRRNRLPRALRGTA
jgi:SLT domain-containing protein